MPTSRNNKFVFYRTWRNRAAMQSRGGATDGRRRNSGPAWPPYGSLLDTMGSPCRTIHRGVPGRWAPIATTPLSFRSVYPIAITGRRNLRRRGRTLHTWPAHPVYRRRRDLRGGRPVATDWERAPNPADGRRASGLSAQVAENRPCYCDFGEGHRGRLRDCVAWKYRLSTLRFSALSPTNVPTMGRAARTFRLFSATLCKWVIFLRATALRFGRQEPPCDPAIASLLLSGAPCAGCQRAGDISARTLLFDRTAAPHRLNAHSHCFGFGRHDISTSSIKIYR